MRRHVIAPFVALGVAVLAGCGEAGSETAAPATGAPAAQTNREARVNKLDAQIQEMERLTADCMKKAGFQYLPDLSRMVGDNQTARLGGPQSVVEPVEEVRAFRQKYGFGQFAGLVYPNDPAVKRMTMNPDDNPNKAIRDALDPARREAYEIALHGKDDGSGKGTSGSPGCAGEAADKVYAGSNSDEADHRAKKRAWEKFQNDPAVVAAAQQYADCLRGKGHQVRGAEPGMVEQSLSTAATEAAGQPGISPALAKTGLEKEIKAALDDLECRTEYATIARTKYAAAIIDGNGVG